MNKILEHFIIIVFVLASLGTFLAYKATQASFISESVRVLDDSGQTTSKAMIKQSPKGAILSILSAFAFSLAISIFISVFVCRKLETSLHAEKQKELRSLQDAINSDVFDSLFKKLVPDEIFDIIKTKVIGNRIIRKNANWIFDFSEADDGNSIKLIQTIKYELHNVSHEKLSDAIDSLYETHDSCGLQRLQCRLDGKEVLSYPTHSGDMTSSSTTIDNAMQKETVKIIPQSDGLVSIRATVDIPPSRHIDVTQVYKTIYMNSCVKDGYFTKYPLINATLTANYPDGYAFSIFQAFSTLMQETLREPGRTIFELSGGVFPHQGFVFSLRKKPTEGEVKT